MRLIKTIALLPIVYIDAFRMKKKSLRERYLSAQKWSKKLLKALGYTLEVINDSPNDEPLYLICNHQSTFDPIMVVASFNQPLTFVSKSENKRIPIISKWADLIELIYFDRHSRSGNISMLRQVSERLKDNHSVLIFPEGTRSKAKQLNPLKEGALQPAKITKTPLCVVTLINSYTFSLKKQKNKVLKIVYGPIIPPSIFENHSYAEVTEIITKAMNENLAKYGS